MASKNLTKNLLVTVNYISCVYEGLIKISNLLRGTPDGQGAGSKPHVPSPNLALQFSPTSTITQQLFMIFVHQDHSRPQ